VHHGGNIAHTHLQHEQDVHSAHVVPVAVHHREASRLLAERDVVRVAAKHADLTAVIVGHLARCCGVCVRRVTVLVVGRDWTQREALVRQQAVEASVTTSHGGAASTARSRYRSLESLHRNTA
jgi:hypothetical protein